MVRSLLILLIACGAPAPKPEIIARLDAQALIAQTPTAIYGAQTDGTIWRHGKSDGSHARVFQAETGPIDFVTSGEDIYYTLLNEEDGTATLYQVGAMGALASGVLPGSLRADETSVYWLDRELGGLMRLPRAGVVDQMAVAGRADAPELALDDTHLYWFDPFTPGVIKRISKTGGAVETVLNGVSAAQLQVDDELIYYLQNGTLFSLRKNGTAWREVIRGPSRFWPVDGDVIYSIYDSRYGNEQALWIMQTDGTHRRSLVFDLGTIRMIQLVRDDKLLFWSDGRDLVRLQLR